MEVPDHNKLKEGRVLKGNTALSLEASPLQRFWTTDVDRCRVPPSGSEIVENRGNKQYLLIRLLQTRCLPQRRGGNEVYLQGREPRTARD